MKNIKLIIPIVIIAVIIILIISTVSFRIIKINTNKIAKEEMKFEIIGEISGVNGLKTSIFVKIQDLENGIKSVEKPDGTLIDAKGKKTFGVDVDVLPERDIYITATNMIGETINKNLRVEYHSIYDDIQKINESQYTTVTAGVKLSGEMNTIASYNVNAIVHNGNLVLDGIRNVEGATLSNKVYEFGNEITDAGTSSSSAQNTVVLKVNGNLTINSEVTLTACKNSSGYGGPKGLIIYCTGSIINNGTITMTARGARAAGENVYLYRNYQLNRFEYVPASGGGRNSSGSGRETGGGLDGNWVDMPDGSSPGRQGYGAPGTSYSGGTGGGSGGYVGSYGWQDGGYNGTQGGNQNGQSPGGGAGNPGGSSGGSSGTGGLLVIYANDVLNYSTISSDGSSGAYYGGSSGGGSVNIFYANEIINNGTMTAYGGYSGGRGRAGNGTVNVTKMVDKNEINKNEIN